MCDLWFVSGSIDDHFAKSLGATWTQLKSTNDDDGSDQCSSDNEMDVADVNVEDHFAKALGETWQKIKSK